MRRGLATLTAACLAASGAVAAGDLPLIPKPVSVTLNAGAPLRLRQGAAIAVPAGDAAALGDARWLVQLARRSRGLALRIDRRGPDAAIVFRRRSGQPSDESYSLSIDHHRAVISAASEAGLVHGLASLWQLIGAQSGRGSVSLGAATIEDQPRYAWRGLLIDSARHRQSVAFLLQTLDQMALHKLNVLQWHLTDDQGWRLPVRGWPRLSTVGAWRIPPSLPGAPRPAPYGGVYSFAEVRAVVARAKARAITIVPEIEMPGHALSALLAYPELSAGPPPSRALQSDWGLIPDAFGVDEPVFAFIDQVMGEAAHLFPGPYVGIGGDEVPLDIWKASPAAQAKMKTLGLASESALQNWFIKRVTAIAAAHGKRAIGWEEILQGGPLPTDAIVASWQGAASAVTAAKAGHDVVLAIAPTLYFDNRQSDLASEPPGRGWVVSLRDVYALDPAAPPLPPAPRLTPGAPPPPPTPTLDIADEAHILGLQGNLWTEHVRTDARAETMLWPRAAAVAEVGWTPQAQRSWPDFLSRLPAEFDRSARLGLTEDRSAFANGLGAPANAGSSRVSQQLSLCPGTLPLNLEGQPTASGRRPVFLIQIMNPCWIWPDAAMDGVTGVTLSVAATPNNLQLGAQEAQVVRRPSAAPGGEIQVRLDDCDKGELLGTAILPAPVAEAELTVTLPPRSGNHSLCFLHAAGARRDPIWGLEAVRLLTPP